MSEIKSVANIDELFSKSLDDLADLPAYETPPPGGYILRCSMDVKKINNKDAVEAAFEVVETVELTDSNDKPVVGGTKFSTAYFLDNEYAIGNMKKFLAPFAEHFGTTSIQSLITEHVKDVTISATIKNRTDKEDKDRKYAVVSNISVM